MLTLWERHEDAYLVVSARAAPGERLDDPDTDASLRPPWMEAETGASRPSPASPPRAAAPRLEWNAVRRAQWAAGTEPWLAPALDAVEAALASRDAAALTAAAPGTGAETAAALAALPADFTTGLTLDMVLDTGGRSAS